MAKSTDDKESPIKKYEDESFVNDECGDYMWDEALKAFEKSEEENKAKEETSAKEEDKTAKDKDSAC